MKFTVIGHFCLDVIHNPGKKDVEGFGGICYSVAALANIAQEDDTIYPIFGVGKTEYGVVVERLSAYPNVDTGGIYTVDGETNRVHLFYKEGGTRAECSASIAPAIPFKRIEPYLNVNGILINMISGLDLALETVDMIRLAVRPKNTPLHLDLHSLTLGVRQKDERFRRAVSDWRRWCFMMNSVQMNEEEAAGLTIEQYGEEQLAKQMLPLMVNALCITRGERGVSMFRQEHKKLLRTDVPGSKNGKSVDATGCGDVFGAAFLKQFCRTNSYEEALRFANTVAAANARLSGITKIDQLSQFREGAGQ
ncbi:MAG: carbohydrate kinase family protein [Ignavibacteriales bacterium]|nr:carbohydrate kinase family protein [Ignavibacteriales bacterium]